MGVTRVPAAFDRGASAYDRLVGANPGYHAHLRRSARAFSGCGRFEGGGRPGGGRRPAGGGRFDGCGRLLDAGCGTGASTAALLDAGCGTGASTAALLDAVPGARIVGVDASAGMLAEARAKPWPEPVRFVHARVEELAEAGVRGPFDGIFAAYLIRNLADPDAVLCSLRALLRPGGLLVVHDYSLAGPAARLVWHAVCWTVIIPAGRLLTGDAHLYRYLWRSVLDFDGPDAFADRLRRAGFTGVRVATMTGWQRGVTHAFQAYRP